MNLNYLLKKRSSKEEKVIGEYTCFLSEKNVLTVFDKKKKEMFCGSLANIKDLIDEKNVNLWETLDQNSIVKIRVNDYFWQGNTWNLFSFNKSYILPEGPFRYVCYKAKRKKRQTFELIQYAYETSANFTFDIKRGKLVHEQPKYGMSFG